jgi:hypothetical protein
MVLAAITARATVSHRTTVTTDRRTPGSPVDFLRFRGNVFDIAYIQQVGLAVNAVRLSLFSIDPARRDRFERSLAFNIA